MNRVSREVKRFAEKREERKLSVMRIESKWRFFQRRWYEKE